MRKSLDSLLLDASSFIMSEFNIELQKSRLKPYSPENWKEFCLVNGFDVGGSGIYVPASYSAYVRTDSFFLVSNVFHEFFGHGLFCEHSQIGKNLVNIIKNGGNENPFLYNEVDPQKQPFGLCKTNIANYEGFAIWLESLLCEETRNLNNWQAKKEGLRNDYLELFEFFSDAEHRLSRFGFMAQLGFPKYYDDTKVLDVIKQLYGSAFANIDFIVLYGSQKPESDIDLCIISTNNSGQYFNGWLDIAELNREDFQNRIDNLDIALTDAMFSGRLLYGGESHFNQLKQKVINSPISKRMIEYNRNKSILQEEYLLHYLHDSRLSRLCISYRDSFSQNAEQLSLGNKPLTLANLKQTYVKYK